jgi:HEAT repeat protein
MMKPAAPEVLPALTRALDDADGRVRCRASLALWLLAKEEKKTVPVLAAGLTHEDREVRREAATALQQFGRAALPAAAELAEIAKNGDLDVSDTAAATLQGIGPEAIPALVRALPDRAAPTHWRIVLVLQTFGPKAADAVPDLIEELQGPTPRDRLLAVEALINIDPQTAGRLVPVLVAAAADDDPYVVSRAAVLACTIGPEAAEVGPTLAVALRHRNETVRLAAADALVRLDRRNAAVALPVLIDALTSEESEEKQEAVRTLVFLGADAKPAAPALARLLGEALLGHNEGLNWRQLTKTLTAMGAGAEAVPALVQVMHSGDENQRDMAICAAALIGADARGAVPALQAALEDDDESVRDAAASALKKITGVDPVR